MSNMMRNEAQEIHNKAFEMKSRIIGIKGDRRKRFQEAKKAIAEQNVKARKATMDEKKLDEIADKSVNVLKKGGKISL